MGLQKAILEGKLAPYPWWIFGKNPAEMEWKTVSGSFDEFCKKIISGILLHRTLAHSLKTRMGRGSIFFARKPARQIWVGGKQVWRISIRRPMTPMWAVMADCRGRWWRCLRTRSLVRSACCRRRARHSSVQVTWQKRWGMWIPTPQWNAIAEAP